MPLYLQGTRPATTGIIALQDVGGGLNLKSSRFTIPPNQATKLENAILVEDGSLLGRRGTLRWNAVSLGAGAVNGATRAYVGASNHFLVSHGTVVYKGSDVDGTFASSLTGLTNNSLAWFVQYLLYVYFANKAGDQPKKWDGTTWSDMGVAAPTGVPTGVAGAAGVPNGTYSIKYTYVTATTESNPSPKSADFTLTNKKGTISGITVGPAGTTKRKIYGFKNTVSTVYQLIGEINNNVDTSATDFIATDQSSWTTTVTSQNDPPPAKAWLTVLFKNRLWKSGNSDLPTRLYFSQIFVPEAWPSTFFIDVPFDFGDQITALFVLGDLLLIFSDNQIFYVIGDTPYSFVIKRSFAQVGTPSPWAVDRVENVAIFGSRFSVNTFDGYQSKIVSDPIEPQFNDILETMDPINYAAANTMTLKYHDRLKAIMMSFPTGISTVNDTSYWFFLRRQGWVRDTRASRLLISTFGRGDQGKFYAWDANTGILRELDVNYTDDGAAITMTYKTGSLSGDNPLNLKHFRWLTVRAYPSGGTLTVNATVDQGQETDSFGIVLSSGYLYGSAVYGTAKYAVDFDEFDEAFEANMKGRTITLELVVSYSQRTQISQVMTTFQSLPSVRRRVSS